MSKVRKPKKPVEIKSMCYDNCGDDNALEGCTYWCTNSGDPVETIVALRAERDELNEECHGFEERVVALREALKALADKCDEVEKLAAARADAP